MNMLTLSGWGQPHDALSVIMADAEHFDYTNYKTIEKALEGIACKAHLHDVIIGWSLGGQLAVRTILKGLIRPKKLILVAVPYQFVQTDESKIGMPRDKFEKFRSNYENNPARTLAKAWELIALNDKNSDKVRIAMGKKSKDQMLEKDWLHWLDMLDGFSFKNIDLSLLPPTLIIHGTHDNVVDFSQSYEFIKSIPQARHIIIEGAGHAPHFFDETLIQKHIMEFLNV